MQEYNNYYDILYMMHMVMIQITCGHGESRLCQYYFSGRSLYCELMDSNTFFKFLPWPVRGYIIITVISQTLLPLPRMCIVNRRVCVASVPGLFSPRIRTTRKNTDSLRDYPVPCASQLSACGNIRSNVSACA